ncbi:MAG: hypothetical protein SNJ55_12130 [Chloroherpetonaceae bacterium]
MKKLILVGIAFLSATTLFAQADIFGGKTLRKTPTESATNSAAPQLLQGERNPSSTSINTSTNSQLESREQSAPTFLRGSGTGRRSGFTFMQATGYGFGAFFGVSAAPRIGYIFENGLYFGGSYQISFGPTFINPQSPAFSANSSAMSALIQSGTFEIGYETDFKLLGMTFYNRPYLALGFADVGFFEEDMRPFGSQNRNATALPQSGLNLFGTAGNVLYYRFDNLNIVRGLTFGLDARYMMLNNASAFGIFFTTGIRLF